jgi:phospholipid/cholesterol/gamma-HCH transport system substrate-binding protein
MVKDASKNIRLGTFVLAGTVFLIVTLYLIGNNHNLFGNTFRISAEFYNVNGLMPGNNVRFSGIDVGTVESVDIVSDSSVMVVMIIEQDIRKFVRKNAVASIGTDGLMGNKIVNINSSNEPSDQIEEGDVLETMRPIEQDEMIRTLNATNENMQVITSNLRTITDRINSKNSLWSLLMDTVVAENVKASIVNIRIASNQSAILTGNLTSITSDIRNGKGTLGALITDTTIAGDLKQIIVKFENINDSVAVISGNVSEIVNGIKDGKGSIGVLLNDTTLVHNLNQGITNINTGSVLLNEDLKAVRESWPFRRYFRKQGKLNSKKN